jgi:hypothetical protein
MSQPESKLSRKIIQACLARGAFAFKISAGPSMMAGLPDVIVCFEGRFVGLETKMPGNGASPIQLHTHDKIRSAGGTCIVVWSVAEAMVVLDDLMKADH